MKYKNTPYFSVVITTYNRAVKLERALSSVLAQTFNDFEVLIMDDGSTDHTSDVIMSIDDTRVHHYIIPHSGSPSRPRNHALEKTRGEYVAFLDSDDWWSNEKLAICHDYVQRNYDVVYHDLRLVKANFWRSTVGARQLKKPILNNLLIQGNAIPFSSAVVRRSIIRDYIRFDESRDIKASEDYHFWLQISQVTDAFYCAPKILGYYCNDGEGISAHKDMSVPYSVAVSNFLKTLDPQSRLSVQAKIEYVHLKYTLRTGKLTSSLQSVLRIARGAPVLLSMKTIIILILAISSLLRYKFKGGDKD